MYDDNATTGRPAPGPVPDTTTVQESRASGLDADLIRLQRALLVRGISGSIPPASSSITQG